jgi:hypothetical protein
MKTEHFYKYLYGQEFHLFTDHSTLTWLLSFKNVEGQVDLSVQCLQEYNFTSEHHQGWKHTNVGALSRRPCLEAYAHCQKVKRQSDKLEVHAIADVWNCATLRRKQLDDDDMGRMLLEVETGDHPE